MTNIVINGVATDLLNFLTGSLDLEHVFAVYWEQRKAAHSGRLPSALDHESWLEFCESDPDAASAFIEPLQSALLSLTERGDVEGEYDLVPTGSWMPRVQVRVTTPLTLYQERVVSPHIRTVFPTEREGTE